MPSFRIIESNPYNIMTIFEYDELYLELLKAKKGLSNSVRFCEFLPSKFRFINFRKTSETSSALTETHSLHVKTLKIRVHPMTSRSCKPILVDSRDKISRMYRERFSARTRKLLGRSRSQRWVLVRSWIELARALSNRAMLHARKSRR